MTDTLELSEPALRYVSDSEPGIRRQRSGRGFCYRLPDGELLRTPRDRQRIQALAIPPAWTDVWICIDEDGHLQATGRDQRNRKQYRYHEGWSMHRDEKKFASLLDFALALPKIRAAVAADLKGNSLDLSAVCAAVVGLLDDTMMRIGNEVYARSNGSHGATTLTRRHLRDEGSGIRLVFTGKSEKQWNVRLRDRRIVKAIRALQDLRGQQLFQYRDEAGQVRPVHSHDVNRYLQAVSSSQFTSKHFRTWGGTRTALLRLWQTPVPETKTAARRALNEAIDDVASLLHNTRAVCRSKYIHPNVIADWEEGRLKTDVGEIRRRYRKPLQGLDADESIVARWLKMRV